MDGGRIRVRPHAWAAVLAMLLLASGCANGEADAASTGEAAQESSGTEEEIPLHEPDDLQGTTELPPDRHPPPEGTDTLARVLYWHEIMLDSSAIDHAVEGPGEVLIYGDQFGPTRTSRAFAIVQIAVFDAIAAIVGGFERYTGIAPAPPGASVDAAIAQAAFETLVALYPSQRSRLAALLEQDLARIPDVPGKQQGVELGARAAEAILEQREDDGSDRPDPVIGESYFLGDEPGDWQQDPVTLIPVAVGAYWAEVEPFVLSSASRLRAPPPPALQSETYADAYEEVKRLGGDGDTSPTARTPEQTVIGIFWAYDKTPGLGAPPRQYNQIAAQLADETDLDFVETARLLALVSVAEADAAIAAWESKYHYGFWRPITGIREADDDGNPATLADPGWTPYGAPASNLRSPNFTPPFPAYPSGHATFGGALFEMLRNLYGTDDIGFTFVSDEYNGLTQNNEGEVRPLTPRSWDSFSEAELENAYSRIYLGIHWRPDALEGIALGRRIADLVYQNVFLPLPPGPVAEDGGGSESPSDHHCEGDHEDHDEPVSDTHKDDAKDEKKERSEDESKA